MNLRPRAGTLLSGLLIVAVAALLVAQVAGRWPGGPASSVPPVPRAAGAASSVPPVPRAAGAAPRLQLGVTTLALARNAYRPWREADLQQVNSFEQRARRHADIVMWFADWAHSGDFDAAQAAAIAARGSVPEISWEPWDASSGSRASQPRYRLSRIIAGDYDAYIRRWADSVASYGRPVRLRFAHEMNGRWYPWAEKANGNHAGEYARTWRRVHAIFNAAGARNVTWIWSPVAGAVPRGLYPGSRHVDVLGVAGFNGGTALFRGTWRSFAVAFGRTLDTVHALDPRKPVELSEVSSTETGGSKAAWIRGMFEEIRRRPWIRALVWFNLRKEADWRIESSPAAQRAFADGISRASR
jgi:mannan endo-1,4-beta-mannosidase